MTLLAWLFGVTISVVPISAMRYLDVGDWEVHDEKIAVTIADTGSWRYNFLIALHEAVEAILCQRHGVTQEEVDQWDQEYCTLRHTALRDASYGHLYLWPESPGDSVLAPYHGEHEWATHVERFASVFLVINWHRYEQRVDEVMEHGRRGTERHDTAARVSSSAG